MYVEKFIYSIMLTLCSCHPIASMLKIINIILLYVIDSGKQNKGSIWKRKLRVHGEDFCYHIDI